MVPANELLIDCGTNLVKSVIPLLNVGTEFKSMHTLAMRTNPKVSPLFNTDIRIPLDVSMNVKKLNKFFFSRIKS